MFCNKCGKEVDDTSDFCNYCGNKLKTEAKTKIETKETEETQQVKDNLEDSKIETFFKEFFKDKTKVIIAFFSIISTILSIIFMSEMSLGAIPSLYMLAICSAGIVNIVYAFNLIEKNNYKYDLLLLSGAAVFFGVILRIFQMGMAASWIDLIKYIVIAIVMLLYIYKFLNNKGKESVISFLLGIISIYTLYLFITMKLPFVTTFIWKIYNLAEATLFMSYIFVLKSNKNNFEEIPNSLKDYKKQIPKIKTVLFIMIAVILIASVIGFIKEYNEEPTILEPYATTNANNGVFENKKFKPSDDLVVEISTLDSDRRDAISLVKNKSDKTIKEYTIAYVGFDSNGNSVNLGYNSTYELFSVTSANILPGEVHGIDNSAYINEDIYYVSATISKITYKDGSIWEADAIEKWAENEVNNFSIDNYKKKISSFSVESNNAENNGYLQVVSSDKYHYNQFSTKDDLDVTIKNVGNKDIRTFSLIVAQYDQNGYGVNTSPYDLIKLNMSGADVDDANLKTGESDEFSWTLFFNPDCSTYKIVVNEIEFSDGTTWKNPNLLYWILYNEDKR